MTSVLLVYSRLPCFLSGSSFACSPLGAGGLLFAATHLGSPAIGNAAVPPWPGQDAVLSPLSTRPECLESPPWLPRRDVVAAAGHQRGSGLQGGEQRLDRSVCHPGHVYFGDVKRS